MCACNVAVGGLAVLAYLLKFGIAHRSVDIYLPTTQKQCLAAGITTKSRVLGAKIFGRSRCYFGRISVEFRFSGKSEHYILLAVCAVLRENWQIANDGQWAQKVDSQLT
jgi:hypothetical protein